MSSTEPFPDGLFRIPVPNVIFSKMGGLSDSALRSLLALIHLSFRFDPVKSKWVHSGGRFTRSDVEAASGLSGQGTRNGLLELESLGWAEVDRSGRSHCYQLTLGVPDSRFTYVPTALLDKLPRFGSKAKLRVVLAVLRSTWGWTHWERNPESGNDRLAHDRWAELSNRALAKMTGRSETAVTQAARALQGEWIGRVRPGNEAHKYRFLPETVRPEAVKPGAVEVGGSKSGAVEVGAVENAPSGRPENSNCEGAANDLTPDRQNSDPPSFSKESFSKDKQRQSPRRNGLAEKTGSPSGKRGAVPNTKRNGNGPPPGSRSRAGNRAPRGEAAGERVPEDRSPPADFSDLPAEKRQLAKKLGNVGVWAGRIAELLSRFSCDRIRANFQLYRRRAAEQTIRKPGAWLYKAITDGYVLPSSESETGDSSPTGKAPAGKTSTGSPSACGTLSSLEHKETVSEAEKDEYIAQGVSEERFHRCLSGRGGGRGPQYMYFDPEAGGPTRRV